MDKKLARIRRSMRGRSRMKTLAAIRLCVHRTPQHIYAQVIDGSNVLVSASTLDGEFKSQTASLGNAKAAKEVGKLVAKRALELGIKKVAFDRSGFKYHGRVMALAEGAREGGLEF